MLKLRPAAIPRLHPQQVDCLKPPSQISSCAARLISVFTDLLHRYLDRAGRSNCRNDIALSKKKKKGRQTMWRGRESEAKGRESSSCYSQGTSEDSQQVWAGSEQEASRALQWDFGGEVGERKREGEEAIRRVHAKGCYTDIQVQFEITRGATYS